MSNYLDGLTIIGGNVQSKPIIYSVKSNVTKTTYKISYASNVEQFSQQYSISYTSYNTSEYTNAYTIAYTSIYGDSVQTYRIRYTSNRDPQTVVDRYYLRYTSSYTSEIYSSYSIRYTTTSASSEAQRVRYRIRYTSQSAKEVTSTYKIRYSTATFYDNSSKYTIKYSTTGAEELLVRSLLLRNDNTTDVLFEIKGVVDKPLDSYLFVLSNMPKYQTLEYVIGESLPYLLYIEPNDLVEVDLFDLEDSSAYTVRGYLLLKDVEDLNGISLDIYDIENDYYKINRSKTYFFGVESSDYIETLVSVKGTTYYFINRSSNYYNPLYLNYTSASMTPTFRFGIDCCFSRKINKTNYSYCSPF